jgi:hypothetical protein
MSPRSAAILRFLFACAAIAGAVWGANRFLIWRATQWVVREGEAIIQPAAGPGDLDASVRRWVEKTQATWPRDLDALVDALYAVGPAGSPAVRAMLERVARVNYGDRDGDWERWHENRESYTGDAAPSVGSRERVALKPRWKTAVGLTGWFSSILVLDKQVFVSSLGSALEDPNDLDDGVVLIDGTTGKPELIPSPVFDGARDVLGLSAGDDRIFAVCRNGVVFAIDREGHQQWVQRLKGAALGPPMSLDINQDGVVDVLVVTRGGRVEALDGSRHTTLWTSRELSPGLQALGAVLSRGAGRDVWVTLPDGAVALLDGRTGKERAVHQQPPGTLGGVVTDGLGLTGGASGAWFADRYGRLWSAAGNRQPPTFLPASPPAGDGLTLIAAARTIQRKLGEQPLLLLCPTSPDPDKGASVWALDLMGTYWRAPLPGAVWSTPLVANLNSASGCEILVATIEAGNEGRLTGQIRVFSGSGHPLFRMSIPASIEATPTLADVDGDNRLELLIADQSGQLHCFSTNSAGPVEWGSLGGDPHNTRSSRNAYSFGQRPSGLQWKWRPE